MSIGTDIIQEALNQIGAHSIVSPADPESIVKAMKVLNSMLQLWLSKSIDMGTTPLKNPGDELNEPLDGRQVIIYNLAVKTAPMFENGKVIVSQDLKRNALSGFDDIRSLYQVITIPDKVVSSTLPRGQGNTRFRDFRIFQGHGTTIKN